MLFKNYLDTTLSQPTKVKLLRFLFETKPEMTGRELARFCKISHMQVYRILKDFKLQGIVTKKRVGGAYIYSLNGKSILVNEVLNPLFKTEGKLLHDIIKSLLKEIEDTLLSVVVFGSAAKGEEKPASDVDIFVLTKSENDSNSIKDFLAEAEVNFYGKTGNRLSPIVLSVAQLKDKFKTNRTLITKILSGQLVSGKAPEEYIHGR